MSIVFDHWYGRESQSVYFHGPWPASMLNEIQDVLDALGVTKKIKSQIVCLVINNGYRAKMLEIKKEERLTMHTDEGLLLMDFLESKGYRCIRVSDRSRANHGYEQGVTFRLPTKTAAVPSAPCPPNE